MNIDGDRCQEFVAGDVIGDSVQVGGDLLIVAHDFRGVKLFAESGLEFRRIVAETDGANPAVVAART